MLLTCEARRVCVCETIRSLQSGSWNSEPTSKYWFWKSRFGPPGTCTLRGHQASHISSAITFRPRLSRRNNGYLSLVVEDRRAVLRLHQYLTSTGEAYLVGHHAPPPPQLTTLLAKRNSRFAAPTYWLLFIEKLIVSSAEFAAVVP